MQKVAKEYMGTVNTPEVKARLQMGAHPPASPTLTNLASLRDVFIAREGRLLAQLGRKMAGARGEQVFEVRLHPTISCQIPSAFSNSAFGPSTNYST